VLKQALGADRFPIKVIDVARDLSKQYFPDDAITYIAGDDLPGFDGALLPAPIGKTGWGIIYNSSIRSNGRINFTLAHEFGHYLAHRLKHPEGIQCGQDDIVRWDSDYRRLEVEANTFAAYILMPFDDYRVQIPADSVVTFEMLSSCSTRYGVSLIAATRRWIEFTSTRAILVISRDGYILWSRPSSPALRSGVFFRTYNRAVPIPDSSLAAQKPNEEDCRAGVNTGPGVWCPEPCHEMMISSEYYDFQISLLQLGRPTRSTPEFEDREDDDAEDLGSVIRRNHGL
jgi:hypothetical protein